MKMLRNARQTLTLMLAAMTFSLPVVAQDIGSPEFDAAVQRFIENNPQVVLNSVNGYVARQQAAQAAEADALYLSHADQFFAGEFPTIGNPNGTITLAYVLDAACAYCRRMTPVLAEIIQDNPDVRIIQRWVPFLGPASQYGARVATLVWQRYPDRFTDFYHEMMTKAVPLTNDVVNSVVEDVLGADVAAILISDVAGEVDGPSLAKTVDGNLELATSADIRGTPFIHIEGTKSEGMFRGAVTSEVLQAAIDAARAAN